MELTNVLSNKKHVLGIGTIDSTTVVCCLVCAVTPFIPEIMGKFIEFTNNIMQNGYALKFKAGSVAFSLEKATAGHEGSAEE